MNPAWIVEHTAYLLKHLLGFRVCCGPFHQLVAAEVNRTYPDSFEWLRYAVFAVRMHLGRCRGAALRGCFHIYDTLSAINGPLVGTHPIANAVHDPYLTNKTRKMNQSIDPSPTALLPSIKNGPKRPRRAIARVHVGLATDTWSAIVDGSAVGSMMASNQLVIPDTEVVAGYATLYSDGSFGPIEPSTVNYQGVVVEL